MKSVLKSAACALAAATFAQSVQAAEPARTPAEWRALAQSDLTAMHDALVENSPAMYVERDSQGFRRWVEDGYAQAQAGLPQVVDARSYYYLLKGYAGGFRDVHINVFPRDAFPEKQMPVAWPGLAVGWRSGEYRVADVDPGRARALPPVGARLVACDGVQAGELARRRLDRYEWDLQMEMGRFETAHLLLWEQGNPFAGAAPKRCTFEADGRRRTYKLSYRPISPERVEHAQKAAAAKAVPAKLGLERWGERGWWIGIPHFGDDQDWKGLFEAVDTQIEAIRAADTVVIDVRGNGGGNSGKAYSLAMHLWSREMLFDRFPALGDLTYRASAASRARHSEHGGDLLKAFDDAIAKGQPTFVWPNPAPPRPATPPENAMKAKIVLLTDQTCTSACLDMMDAFLAMPNVVQAGIETNGDTIFMDIARAELPSGLARLHYGHKAWHQRPRGSNVTYEPAPQLTYSGDIADDKAWKSWLAEALRRPAG